MTDLTSKDRLLYQPYDYFPGLPEPDRQELLKVVRQSRGEVLINSWLETVRAVSAIQEETLKYRLGWLGLQESFPPVRPSLAVWIGYGLITDTLAHPSFLAYVDFVGRPPCLTDEAWGEIAKATHKIWADHKEAVASILPRWYRQLLQYLRTPSSTPASPLDPETSMRSRLCVPNLIYAEVEAIKTWVLSHKSIRPSYPVLLSAGLAAICILGFVTGAVRWEPSRQPDSRITTTSKQLEGCGSCQPPMDSSSQSPSALQSPNVAEKPPQEAQPGSKKDPQPAWDRTSPPPFESSLVATAASLRKPARVYEGPSKESQVIGLLDASQNDSVILRPDSIPRPTPPTSPPTFGTTSRGTGAQDVPANQVDSSGNVNANPNTDAQPTHNEPAVHSPLIPAWWFSGQQLELGNQPRAQLVYLDPQEISHESKDILWQQGQVVIARTDAPLSNTAGGKPVDTLPANQRARIKTREPVIVDDLYWIGIDDGRGTLLFTPTAYLQPPLLFSIWDPFQVIFGMHRMIEPGNPFMAWGLLNQEVIARTDAPLSNTAGGKPVDVLPANQRARILMPRAEVVDDLYWVPIRFKTDNGGIKDGYTTLDYLEPATLPSSQEP